MSMERGHLIVPMRINPKAIMALESFSQALLELETYAVARLVPKDGKDPTLVLLAPCIEPGYTKCLYEVELPFAEDMRAYKFPPLDRILTISGKVLKEHRHLPSPALQSAMDDFVDQMDISKLEVDDEGSVRGSSAPEKIVANLYSNPVEYAQMENTFSPMLHRINQVIRYRAVHPDGEVPPPMDILVKYMNPPDELMERVMPYVEKVRETSDVKRVPPKNLNKKRGRGNRKEEKPRSNLDVAALLTARNKESGYKITADNTIPEFKQVLDDTGDIAVVENAVKQVGNIATEMIKFSLGDDKYDRVVEIMQVMRTECIELETPNLYNEFARTLKEKMLSEQLNGDRREMWWKMKKMRLGLIDKRTSEQSDATEEDAQAVSVNLDVDDVVANTVAVPDDEMNDKTETKISRENQDEKLWKMRYDRTRS
jgi:ATP-dependent DNA helicase 2 subunit 2